MTKHLRLVVFSIAGATLLMGFQNCGQNLQVADHPEKETFKRAEECLAGTSSHGACLFAKSPVVQAGKAVSADYVGGYQTTAVTLQETNSGLLENTHLQVITGQTSRLSATAGFRHYFNPANSNLEQVSSYYFADELRRWLSERGGTAHHGQGFKIVPDAGFSGFIPARKEIHLERNGVNLPAALDGTLVQHLYGQAYIWAATAGQSHDNVSASGTSCKDARGFIATNGCCQSNAGCASAAVSGSADFLTAVYFSALNTGIGEGWKNDVQGLRTCGLSRNPALQSDLSRSQAHQACSSRGASGNVTTMGVLYASIWWEVRKQAADKTDFDRFFVRHLSEIRGEDTFLTLKSKALTIDTNSFGGRYGSLVNAEFAKRGF